MRKLLIVLTASLEVALGQNAITTDHNLNGWYIYSGDHPVKGKFGVHLEGQLRRHNLITRGQQWQLRPAVNYQVKPGIMISSGYAFTATYRYGGLPVDYPFHEHRLYQQLSLKKKWRKTTVENRFRLEQRWLERKNGRETLWRYQDRFRYFLKGSIPIKGKWYLASYNEIFINGRRATGAKLFDQNRAYAALGATVNKTTRVEVGYLQQTLSRFNGRAFEYNHTFQLALFSTR